MQKGILRAGIIAVAFIAAFYALNGYIRYQELHGGVQEENDGQRQRGDVAPTGLIGGGWTWIRADLADGSVIEAPAGGQFVLSFDEDGLMFSTTDCNSLSGSYTKDDETLTFGPMASTLMFCEGSLEGEYAPRLASAVSYAIDGGTLRLTLGDGGTMTFMREEKSVGKVSGDAADPKDAMYLIEGENATLTGGVAETADEDGVAKLTRYFGNETAGDMDGDGQDDMVLLLTQERGGSGIFYYVAVALRTDGGWRGTNAVLLGDRIAPQTTSIAVGRATVNYADRKPGEPFTARASVGVSRHFEVVDGVLTEVAGN